MIRLVHILGSPACAAAQHGQRPHEWGPPQCKYYGLNSEEKRMNCFNVNRESKLFEF